MLITSQINHLILNVDYITNKSFNFSSIDIYNNGLYLNGSILKHVPDAGSITVYIEDYNPPNYIKYKINTTGAVTTVNNTVGGFTTSNTYSVYVDGSYWQSFTANASGIIMFDYSSWSNHTFEIYQIDIDIHPNWNAGIHDVGTSNSTSYTYFTCWNNGTVDTQVKIALNNSAEWTYVDWNTYHTGEAYCQFTANFTTDGTTWANIAPKVGDEPQTVLFSNLQAGTSDTFGLLLWYPKKISSQTQQSIQVYVKGVKV